MNYSYKLTQIYKEKMGYKQDKQVVHDVKGLTTGNLSEIKRGVRHLNATQCIFIANKVGIDQKEALLNLAIEKSKTDEESKVWSDIVKKISAACLVLALMTGIAENENKGAFA